MPRAFLGTERYEVVRQLGVGGAGVVYQVRDRETGAMRALNEFLDEP
jgi:hypothetical protein